MRCSPVTLWGEGCAPSPADQGAAAPQGGGLSLRRRPGLLREVLVILGLFVLYRLGRLALTGQDELAIDNAWWVWGIERMLWMPDEEVLQDWALQWPDLLRAANWYYVGVHFPITAAFLAWGWWRRPPEEYRWARRLLTVLTGMALAGHVVMPLAPPRMLTSLGFLDTMATFGPSAYKGSAATVANQFAAMPSLHVGWALLISVVVIRTAAGGWRWLTLLHPAITVAVVVVTANHYWVDAIAAALLLGLALLVTPTPHGAAPVVVWWRWMRDRQAIGTRSTSSPVGSIEPPLGSMVRPSPSAEPMSCTNASSAPPRPRTPTD